MSQRVKSWRGWSAGQGRTEQSVCGLSSSLPTACGNLTKLLAQRGKKKATRVNAPDPTLQIRTDLNRNCSLTRGAAAQQLRVSQSATDSPTPPLVSCSEE